MSFLWLSAFKCLGPVLCGTHPNVPLHYPKSTRSQCIWGFPKIGGVPFLGVPIIRTKKNWGLYWGRLNLGNYQVFLSV